MDVLEVARNLTQQVAYSLGQAIVQGKFDATGGLPTEAELSAEFNTSRSVTREAVKMLTAKGLIASRPRQGIRVQPTQAWNLFDSDVLKWLSAVKPSPALQQEFAQLRWAIEPEAVVLAARLGCRDKIRVIGEALSLMRRNEPSSPQDLDGEVRFHTAILQASGNRFFSQFGGFIQIALRANLGASNGQGCAEADLDLYQAIFDAIVKGRQQEGRAAMCRLLTGAPARASALETI